MNLSDLNDSPVPAPFENDASSSYIEESPSARRKQKAIKDLEKKKATYTEKASRWVRIEPMISSNRACYYYYYVAANELDTWRLEDSSVGVIAATSPSLRS